MTPDQNPPVDPAALAAAETKVLPRFPGYREMIAGEVLQDGDMVCPMGASKLQKTIAAGEYLIPRDVGHYFRPIPQPSPSHKLAEDEEIQPGIPFTVEKTSTPESLTGPQALHAAEVMRAISVRETVVLPRPEADSFLMGELAVLSRERAALLEAVTRMRDALQCVQAMDMHYNEGMPILAKHGFEVSTRFDFTPSAWTREKVAAALAFLESPALVDAVKTAGGSK